MESNTYKNSISKAHSNYKTFSSKLTSCRRSSGGLFGTYRRFC